MTSSQHPIITDIVFATSDVLILEDKKLFEKLSAYINELIIHDFERLVSLLYRIDVDENKLQALLEFQPDINSGDTIATLILERQVQKIKSRKANHREDSENSEAEKW
jgi:hypothetical protein